VAVDFSGKDTNILENWKERCYSQKYFKLVPAVCPNAAVHQRNTNSSSLLEEVERIHMKDERSLKRQQKSPDGRRIGETLIPKDTGNIKECNFDPITLWIEELPWPKEDFERESTIKDY
jgi:hypothetical protein